MLTTTTSEDTLTNEGVDGTEGLSPQAKHRHARNVALVLLPICIAMFASALEQTAVSTALPTIVRSLGDFPSSDFIWAGSCYSLASAAVLPMSGAFSQIFGRKPIIMTALLLFAAGSAICGAAMSRNVFLVGRTVQGMGSGGILTLANLILSDLVPLSERGKYNAMLGISWSVASAVGPSIGGALAQHGAWRWLFYLNIPLCGVCAVGILTLLHLRTPRDPLADKIRRIDWFGNVLIITSTTSIVLALTWGGVTYPWRSFHVLLPLILGFCGMAALVVYEKNYPEEPTIPYFLLTNRTSLGGYIQTLLLNCVVLCFIYYLPVYFQACKLASPTSSGLDTMGLSLSVAPIGILAGISVVIYQCYRPQLWLGWSLLIVSMGLLSTITASTEVWRTIGYCVLSGAAMGLIFTITIYPVLAPLPVSSNAPAIALAIFFRVFGQIWGITIGGTVLQNELSKRVPKGLVEASGDLTYAVITSIREMPEDARIELQNVFAESMRTLWLVMLGISAVGLVSSLMMEGLPLHTNTDEAWAMEKKHEEAEDSQTRIML
ncbi:Mfs1.2 [Mycena floridula]|nr:Mfs1.2 [Mycena floridula]